MRASVNENENENESEKERLRYPREIRERKTNSRANNTTKRQVRRLSAEVRTRPRLLIFFFFLSFLILPPQLRPVVVVLSFFARKTAWPDLASAIISARNETNCVSRGQQCKRNLPLPPPPPPLCFLCR